MEFVDNPTLNTDTPQGEFMLMILAAVAQLERATTRERQAEGIAVAKKKGGYDRSTKLDAEQVSLARQRVSEGVPKVKVARGLRGLPADAVLGAEGLASMPRCIEPRRSDPSPAPPGCRPRPLVRTSVRTLRDRQVTKKASDQHIR